MRCFFLPGGLVLLLTTVLLCTSLPLAPSAITLLFYVGSAASLLLSIRFRSSRALFALLTLFLAQRAISFYAPGHIPVFGPGRIALEVISVLLPFDLLAIALLAEQGFRQASLGRYVGVLLLESIFVAFCCRSSQTKAPGFIRFSLFTTHSGHHANLPPLAIAGFAITLTFLCYRVFRFRRPLESGLLWCLVACFAALANGGVGHVASAYFASSVLVLVSALVESSYVLAYQDELTGLPGRRAFNDARDSLVSPYAIAIVDIDFFKSFNDTYGHDTGDQVLRMVAAKLARVTGGGRAFRVGGEEFSILFRDRSLADVMPHLQSLRQTVEEATFQLRTVTERRETRRQLPDRRTRVARAKTRRLEILHSQLEECLAVTVSIGVAESTRSTQRASAVYEAADKALYRAKKAGRNRVEAGALTRPRKPRLKSSIA